ncbi:hypothetical protein D3C87_105930 [compost metagenome]
MWFKEELENVLKSNYKGISDLSKRRCLEQMISAHLKNRSKYCGNKTNLFISFSILAFRNQKLN